VNAKSDSDFTNLLAAADALIASSQSGDQAAARQLLENVWHTLNSLLSGQYLDEERRKYLAAHAESLRQIVQDRVDARKALGTFAEPAAKPNPLLLWMATGIEFDRLTQLSRDAHTQPPTVSSVQKTVARRYIGKARSTGKAKDGLETVRKAWEQYGGLKNWRAASPLPADPA
jgi:hypothetical protein